MSAIDFRVDGQAPDGLNTVVLMHGMFGSKGNLWSVAQALESRCHVVAVDLPGHGNSATLRDMSFSRMAGMLEELFDDNGWDRVHLVGHSLGGKVGMQLASRNPQRVLSLSVLDIAPVSYTGRGHDTIFDAVKAIDLAQLESRQQALEIFMRYTDEKDVAKFILTNLKRTGDQFSWRIDFQNLYDNYDRLALAPEFVHAYTGPALILKGELSAYIQTKHQPAFEQYLPGASHVVVEGAGHWLHAEKPEKVQSLVCDFIFGVMDELD